MNLSCKVTFSSITATNATKGLHGFMQDETFLCFSNNIVAWSFPKQHSKKQIVMLTVERAFRTICLPVCIQAKLYIPGALQAVFNSWLDSVFVFFLLQFSECRLVLLLKINSAFHPCCVWQYFLPNAWENSQVFKVSGLPK